LGVIVAFQADGAAVVALRTGIHTNLPSNARFKIACLSRAARARLTRATGVVMISPRVFSPAQVLPGVKAKINYSIGLVDSNIANSISSLSFPAASCTL